MKRLDRLPTNQPQRPLNGPAVAPLLYSFGESRGLGIRPWCQGRSLVNKRRSGDSVNMDTGPSLPWPSFMWLGGYGFGGTTRKSLQSRVVT